MVTAWLLHSRWWLEDADTASAREQEVDMTRKRYIPWYYKNKAVLEVSERGVVF
jgi:hypothetical protein